MLAHAERCPIFLRSPELLEELVAEGMLAQVTASALTGAFGRHVRGLAEEMIRSGTVHAVGSDAHGPGRPATIGDELRRAGITPPLATWLTADVPDAVLSGSEIPPRPETAPRRRQLRMVGVSRRLLPPAPLARLARR